MSAARRAAAGLLSAVGLVALAGGCERRHDGTMGLPQFAASSPVGATASDQPPVALNAISPVEYPPALLHQGIEGQVLLRLFVDTGGKVIPDSSRIVESSGYPALDSAALAGSPRLRFSPALHRGRRVAVPFLQPVQFRVPRTSQRP